MTTATILLATAVLAPLAGSLALPLVARASGALRDAAALALVLVAAGCVAALVPQVLAGGAPTVSAGGLALLHADRLAVGMALVSAGLGAVIVVYSFGYVARLAHRGEYYLMVVLFVGAMMGLVFARHLLVLYACWELTAVACWRLVAFHRTDAAVRRADKAFLVTGGGAVVMLLGFVAIWAQAGTFDLGALQGARLGPVATALVLAGLLSKSATLPLHAWLPDAGVAPAPVTALLHAAVLVKIGVYVHARLFGATVVMDPGWQAAVPWIALASALAAGAAALLETDLKRIVAYSTVSQLAFVFLGLSAGSAAAAGGALLLVAAHAVAKGGLFLCAGVIEHAVHTKDVRRMGGLARRMPLTAAAFALCAASVAGLPPFAGFAAKHLVLEGAFAAAPLPVALGFVTGSVLTVLYLARAFSLVFLGAEGPAVRGHDVREGSRAMVGSVVALAALALAGGLLVRWPAALAAAAAGDLARVPGAVAEGLGAAGLLHWESLAVLLPALLAIRGGPGGARAALRGVVTLAVAELVVLAGAGLAGAHAAPALAAAGAALAAAGAAARLGAMPFHGWIPAAAEDASAPAVAIVATATKLAGTIALASLAAAGGLGAPARAALLGLGGLSLALGLGLALVQVDGRRRVAHLSGAHGGAVLLALAAGHATAALGLAVVGALALAAGFVLAAPLDCAPLRGATLGASGVGRLAVRLRAAERALEPAAIARGAVDALAVLGFAAERLVNALFDVVAVAAARALATGSRRAHDGSHATYLVWSMAGLVALLALFVGGR